VLRSLRVPVAAAAVAAVLATPTGPSAPLAAAVVHARPASALRSTGQLATRATRYGHPSHPVWYHDTVAVRVGDALYVAWTSSRSTARFRRFGLSERTWLGPAAAVSTTALDCHCSDSTGTNPNRHDVPALAADPAGWVYAVFGGGTASAMGDHTGPYLAVTTTPGGSVFGPPVRLAIPGAAYDVEAVRSASGTTHMIGQQGRNPAGAGSLLYLRLRPGTAGAPGSLDFAPEGYRTLVRGGEDPKACAWRQVPGCDVYVIGRLASGPAPGGGSMLALAWGWSEGNLSNSCGDPAGFCNHGLYFARSLDGGDTWTNADGSASVSLATGPIAYGDPRFQVVAPKVDVGLYKAVILTGPASGTPSIVYEPGADLASGGMMAVARLVPGTGWVRRRFDISRPWNDPVVARPGRSGGVDVWADIAQSGAHASSIEQWVVPSVGPARRSELVVGPNWFLTGTPIPLWREALVFRAERRTTSSSVAVTLLHAG
jgi:hypothetical protein